VSEKPNNPRAWAVEAFCQIPRPYAESIVGPIFERILEKAMKQEWDRAIDFFASDGVGMTYDYAKAAWRDVWKPKPLPCPFCGAKAEPCDDIGGKPIGDGWWVCPTPGCMEGAYGVPTEQWNRRA